MKLSIIIVNYNVRYFLDLCLLSVKRAMENIESEVIVVDNASSDNSVGLVTKKFPWVKLIANANNSGFSKANNQGIAIATGEYILLLNPDTVVAEDTFEKCLLFMDSHSDAGALGVHMVDGKGNFLPESKRGLPTPSVAFYKTFGLAAIFPKSRIFGRYHLGFLPEQEIHEVEVLSGAFMLIRKQTLQITGLLDEAFFMYGEDIDLSYRITKAGYKNYYFPVTTIIHYKGESTKKGSVNYVKIFYQAMLIFAKKHYSANQSGWFSILIKLAILFRGFLTVLAGLFSSSYLFIVDALLSFTGIYFIKTYWESMIKYSEHYYPNQFLFIVVPIYIFFWVLATFISGGYDKPYRIGDILRGIFSGTLFIAAIYAFLPETWRFSRAMILLGAAWTAAEMLLTRISYQLIKNQSFSIEEEIEKRTLIAGEMDECIRAEKLITTTGTGNEIVGFIPDLGQLPSFSRIYEAAEIIFCTSQLQFTEIIKSMVECGNALSYKMLNKNSDAIVGSDSKDTAGDMYSYEQLFNIGNPVNRRKKRLFDFGVCLIFIPLLPVNLIVIKNPGKFISNWMAVLKGLKTWVGYALADEAKLPKINDGVLSVAQGLSDLNLNLEVSAKLDLLYARHYRVKKDLKILLWNYSSLGN